MPDVKAKSEVRSDKDASREERRRAEKEKKEKLLETLKREIEQLSTRWRVTTYLSGGSYGEVCGAVDTVTSMHFFFFCCAGESHSSFKF